MYSNGKKTDIGLLFLRVAIGALYIGHGFPKVVGGPDVWVGAGSAVQYLGIPFFHDIFGFIAGCIELFGGILLIFGFGMLPVLILLLLTMLVAVISKFAVGAGYGEISYPLMAIAVFISLMLTGPGKYSIDYNIWNRRRY